MSRPTSRIPTSVRVANLSLTLVLVGAITWFATHLAVPTFEGGHLTVLMGFVLLAASLAGGLASAAGLPRLTGFLLVGIAAGPSVLGLLPAPAVAELRLIDEFALALIALLAGGELKVAAMRAQARPILLTTLAVTVVVWVGMAGVILAARPLIPFLAELPWSATVGVALLLGIWMANSSPDLTVAVIEETGAKGEFTDVVLGVTIVKDVVVIILFTLSLNLVGPLIEEGVSFDSHVLVELGQHVGGAAVVGALLGWIFSLYLGGEDGKPKPPLATFLFAYVLVVISSRLHLELLLTAVAAGFIIENLSPAGDRMIRGIESVSVVIFAFFFAIAGAGLELAAIRQFWLAALVLFAGRAFFTWLGARLGSTWGGASEAVRKGAWQGLVSQGGVSLLLVLSIGEKYPTVGGGVVALAMAIIIGNILGGPVLLKRALTREGTEG
ncbi:MAG TPA: cation:proton antiporter [Longimicrobiales bacterium]|nr:cation:proton antiporter [Longimicrobiales bacterium]